MKKLLLLITTLFILASVEGQILRYSNYVAPTPPEEPGFDGGIINNGDFSDGDTDWTPDANWSIAGGVATFSDAASGELLQASTDMVTPLGLNKTYDMSLTLTLGTATSVVIDIRASTGDIVAAEVTYTTGGAKNLTLTTPGWGAAEKGIIIYGSSASNGTFSIDNIIVNEQ